MSRTGGPSNARSVMTVSMQVSSRLARKRVPPNPSNLASWKTSAVLPGSGCMSWNRAACAETIAGARIELKSGRALRPLKPEKSGWLTRLGGILSGPVPLVLRLLAGRRSSPNSKKLRRFAAASCLAGAALTRTAWIAAGTASVADPAVSLGAADGKSK